MEEVEEEEGESWKKKDFSLVRIVVEPNAADHSIETDNRTHLPLTKLTMPQFLLRKKGCYMMNDDLHVDLKGSEGPW